MVLLVKPLGYFELAESPIIDLFGYYLYMVHPANEYLDRCK